MTENCGNCKFLQYGNETKAWGYCRIVHPVKIDNRTAFPEVYVEEWCGEYKPKIKEGYKLTGKRDIQIEEEDYLDNWAVYV